MNANCKKTNALGLKSCKIQYFKTSENHAPSAGWEFFTDDYLERFAFNEIRILHF